jgi:hypothetical protein
MKVSRQWSHILRSPDVIKRNFWSWSNSVVDLYDADFNLYRLKAKQIQTFRMGEPNRYFLIDTHDPQGYVALVEDTLVWSCDSLASRAARIIYVFNMKTWSLQTLNGDARETVYRLFASDQLVGFATSGNACYAWALRGYEKRKFRVPNSALFQSVTCRESTVACVGCLNDHALVYIWNYDTQRGISFSIAFDTPLFSYHMSGYVRVFRLDRKFSNLLNSFRCHHRHGLALLLQPKNEQITVFVDDCCSVPRCHNIGSSPADRTSAAIRYSQYTYKGQCVSASEMAVQNLPTGRGYRLHNQITPVNRHGLFKISIAGAWLQFDEQLNKFTKVRPMMYADRLWVDPSLFWWNDVFFQAMEPLESAGTASRPVLAHAGTRCV